MTEINTGAHPNSPAQRPKVLLDRRLTRWLIPMLRHGRSRFKVIQLAPLLAVLALTCWAFASPVGSSPDDNFHLASIWCAGGNTANECRTLPDESRRAIPEALVKSDCFAFKPNQSAACQGTIFDGTQNRMVSTATGNFAGTYPRLYYRTMNLFVSSNIELSVLLMRIANILLFVGLSTVLYRLLPARRRPPLVWGLAASIVPLGLFLLASDNPSSWAIISAGTLWISLVGYFECSGVRKVGLGVVAALSTIVGAGARADSAIYAVVAIGAVVILSARLNRRWIVSALLPLALAVTAAAFFFSTQQSLVAVSGLPGYGDSGPVHSGQELFFKNFLSVPSLWTGVFGHTGLGWMDTQLPALVWVGGFGCCVALAFSGLVSQSARKLLAVLMVLSALLLFPTYVAMRTGNVSGMGVQPRYILPLIILLIGVLLLEVGRARLRLSTAQVVALVSTLSVANAIALQFNIRRYITGADVVSWNLNAAVEWWWSIGVSPMTVWALGSLSFAGLLVILARATTLTRFTDVPQGAPELQDKPASFDGSTDQGGNAPVLAIGAGSILEDRPAYRRVTTDDNHEGGLIGGQQHSETRVHHGDHWTGR